MSQVTWIIQLEAKENKIDALKNLVLRIQEEVKQCPGNQSVRAVQHNDIRTRFTLIEVWDSKAEHEKYLQQVAKNGVLETAAELLAKPFQGTYHTEI